MLKNIVVSLDGSDYSWSAAYHAIRMARAFRATLNCIFVTDVKIVKGQLLDDLNVDTETAKSIYADKRRALFEQFENECKSANVAFKSIPATGAVAGLICRTALELKAELVCIGKKGVNAQWSGPFLGSVAESIVHQARRPILLAQENYAPVESLYVAYDGEIVSIRALRFAAEICARCKWKMNVISVHRSPKRRDELLNQAEDTAVLHGIKVTKIGKSGDVSQQILDIVSEYPSALIVMGAYSNRLRDLILGSVPERVMRRAKQPILVYRPFNP